MKEFDDFGNPFDLEDEPEDDFENEFEDEESDENELGDGEGNEEIEEENEEGSRGNNIETDQVLGECSLCGTEVTQGWLDQWGAVGENGWEAFKICPNCQAGAFFENGGHF